MQVDKVTCKICALHLIKNTRVSCIHVKITADMSYMYTVHLFLSSRYVSGCWEPSMGAITRERLLPFHHSIWNGWPYEGKMSIASGFQKICFMLKLLKSKVENGFKTGRIVFICKYCTICKSRMLGKWTSLHCDHGENNFATEYILEGEGHLKQSQDLLFGCVQLYFYDQLWWKRLAPVVFSSAVCMYSMSGRYKYFCNPRFRL